MKYVSLIFVFFIACANDINIEAVKKETRNEELIKKVDDVYESDVPETGINSDRKPNPYDFDTILQDGYYLKYERDSIADESGLILKRLVLMHKNKEVSLVSEYQIEHQHRRLGYISSEFEKEFIFASSGGGQSQVTFDLIEKKTGDVIIHGNLICDYILNPEGYNNLVTENYFIYESDDNWSSTSRDEVSNCFIYDVKNRERFKIDLPKDLNEECMAAIS
jgi:hypothetical protein